MQTNVIVNDSDYTEFAFKYHNYSCFPIDIDPQIIFIKSCHYNYITLVNILLNNKDYVIGKYAINYQNILLHFYTKNFYDISKLKIHFVLIKIF